MTRGGWLLIGRLATGMDRVTNRYFANTADPSTALRSGRDDKGRVVTYRKASDWDGQSYEPLLREHCRSLHCASLRFGMTRGGWLLIGRLATGMDRVTNRYFANTADPSTALRSGRDDNGTGGRYFEDCNEASSVSQRPSDFSGGVAPYALNPDNAARLWAIAQTLIS